REEEQARQAKLQTAVSIGATVLGTLFGRRGLGRATTAARGVGRSLDQAGDVGRAEENVAKLREELAALDAELRAEIEELGDRIDPLAETLEAITVRPEKNDVAPRIVALGWLPWWAGPGGAWAPARGDLD
ncbi:MAG: ATP-binding protein, partial [Gemmatimonadota bacterium]